MFIHFSQRKSGKITLNLSNKLIDKGKKTLRLYEIKTMNSLIKHK